VWLVNSFTCLPSGTRTLRASVLTCCFFDMRFLRFLVFNAGWIRAAIPLLLWVSFSLIHSTACVSYSFSPPPLSPKLPMRNTLRLMFHYAFSSDFRREIYPRVPSLKRKMFYQPDLRFVVLTEFFCCFVKLPLHSPSRSVGFNPRTGENWKTSELQNRHLLSIRRFAAKNILKLTPGAQRPSINPKFRTRRVAS
jgi:hypothetical protein